jgi:hypothetical protein
MLCTAEMTYEHARLCIAINFKIEYWLLPKVAKGIRELYMIVSIPRYLGLKLQLYETQ